MLPPAIISRYWSTVLDITEDSESIRIPSKQIVGYTIDIHGVPSLQKVFTVYLQLEEALFYEKGKTSLEFFANDDSSHTDEAFQYKIIQNDGIVSDWKNDYTKDETVTIKAYFTEHDVISTIEKTINIKVIFTDKPVVNKVENGANVSMGTIQNAVFEKLYISIDGANFVEYQKNNVTLELELGTHLVKAYQVVSFIDGNSILIESEVSTKNIEIEETETTTEERTTEEQTTEEELDVPPLGSNNTSVILAILIAFMSIIALMVIFKLNKISVSQ